MLIIPKSISLRNREIPDCRRRLTVEDNDRSILERLSDLEDSQGDERPLKRKKKTDGNRCSVPMKMNLLARLGC